jgi:D-alanine-D-alanine ligase
MTICILYGGKSGEHEVSLRSAASVVRNLDPARYRLIGIGIDKSGRWHVQEGLAVEELPGQGGVLPVRASAQPACVVPGEGIHGPAGRLPIDCVFPVLHGANGEDGTVQGLLEIAGLPYVGAGVLGSSASMDKETTKRLWRDAGLPIVAFEVVDHQTPANARREAATRIGWPVFVKPCGAGSSLGASRAESPDQLDAVIEDALRYDTRALIERCVDAREIECAVIGNARPRAFPPGEIVPTGSHRFYDYDAKYQDPDGATLETSARLPEATRQRIMRAAEAAYAVVRCEGMARVDFFVDRGTGEISINEINTIPGFTSISMFPRMCDAGGLPYPKLLDALIGLALERHAERQAVRTER